MIKKSSMILLLLLLISTFANADIPPPKGYSKIRVNLVIETNEDLSDYKFFFDFSGALAEVKVKSKAKTTIPPIGGGVRYSSGDFLAIPKKSLEEFGEKLTYEQLNSLSDSINNKKIEGVIELGEHIFIKTIKGFSKDSSLTYIIERQENSLKISPKKKTPIKKKVSSLFDSDDEENYAQSDNHKAIGGVFLSLFFLIGGVFAFRKVR